MTNTNVSLHVRVLLDGKEIQAADLKNITISNATVDRIINDVVQRKMSSNKDDIDKTA